MNTNPVQPITMNQVSSKILAEIIKEQEQQRGFTPLALETDLLLKRIKDGGHSGYFLAKAFLSMYRSTEIFNCSLCNFNKLDAEGMRLFHQILHVRLIKGWRDDDLYELEQKIKALYITIK
jgi:hypothetical protein